MGMCGVCWPIRLDWQPAQSKRGGTQRKSWREWIDAALQRGLLLHKTGTSIEEARNVVDIFGNYVNQTERSGASCRNRIVIVLLLRAYFGNICQHTQFTQLG